MIVSPSCGMSSWKSWMAYEPSAGTLDQHTRPRRGLALFHGTHEDGPQQDVETEEGRHVEQTADLAKDGQLKRVRGDSGRISKRSGRTVYRLGTHEEGLHAGYDEDDTVPPREWKDGQPAVSLGRANDGKLDHERDDGQDEIEPIARPLEEGPIGWPGSE
jgi:hypothetical protein